MRRTKYITNIPFLQIFFQNHGMSIFFIYLSISYLVTPRRE
ncbi:MAG: hypothetical protein ACD_78C00058G0003, partial [uncultured bacterium (gcode 4)]